MTPFWTFLTFSLLSYIEIYIEYREKALGGRGLAMFKKLRKNLHLLNTCDRPINHLGTFEFPKKWFFEPP